jgi:urease accessory protein
MNRAYTRATMRTPWLSTGFLFVAGAPALLAHPGHGDAGFAAGMAHPLFGWDHLLAMVAVGLLAVRVAGGPGASRHGLWQVPATFMGAMVAGGLLALAGLPLPGIEWGIMASVLLFGVLAALVTPPSARTAMLVVAAFGVLHGHAHVAEMTGTAVAPYMLGFLATTATLHAMGVASGVLAMRAWNAQVVRLAGASVAVVGLGLWF